MTEETLLVIVARRTESADRQDGVRFSTHFENASRRAIAERVAKLQQPETVRDAAAWRTAALELVPGLAGGLRHGDSRDRHSARSALARALRSVAGRGRLPRRHDIDRLRAVGHGARADSAGRPASTPSNPDPSSSTSHRGGRRTGARTAGRRGTRAHGAGLGDSKCGDGRAGVGRDRDGRGNGSRADASAGAEATEAAIARAPRRKPTSFTWAHRFASTARARSSRRCCSRPIPPTTARSRRARS